MSEIYSTNKSFFINSFAVPDVEIILYPASLIPLAKFTIPSLLYVLIRAVFVFVAFVFVVFILDFSKIKIKTA